jgi:hypothetical protein
VPPLNIRSSLLMLSLDAGLQRCTWQTDDVGEKFLGK